MALLIVFGFIAGAATAISPCVLPVLPVALSAGATGGRRRPLGIVVGLAVSFTFATVALVYLIAALGLPNDLLRNLAIIVLISFGIALMVPSLSARIEAWLSGLAGRVGIRPTGGDGFWSGTALGASLGLVYTPCAGPILAGVITVSASQSFTAGRLAVAFSYGIGSAAVLYLMMLGGRRLAAPLARRGFGLQIATGAVMVVFGLAMLGEYDIKFQNAIASDLPAFLVNPSESIETSGAAQKAIASLRGTPAPLPKFGPAPEFVDNQRWFNTPGDRPLTMRGLRGKVVLVDFWTYSCINCLRTLPYLKAWYARYHKDGLTIVGVHSPEFPFEKDANNVEEAIQRNGIKYPVVQDNNLATWTAYRNEAWPAEYFIDASGRLRFSEVGEGRYGEKEKVIRELLAERGSRVGARRTKVHAIAPSLGVTTPETYLGAARAERFINPELSPGLHEFGEPHSPPLNETAYQGRWRITLESARAEGGSFELHFGARRVYMVLGSPGVPRHMRVFLDGRPIPASVAGSDVHHGVVTVSAQRLYQLVNLPRVQQHVLRLVPESGVTGYSFTFG